MKPFRIRAGAPRQQILSRSEESASKTVVLIIGRSRFRRGVAPAITGPLSFGIMSAHFFARRLYLDIIKMVLTSKNSSGSNLGRRSKLKSENVSEVYYIHMMRSSDFCARSREIACSVIGGASVRPREDVQSMVYERTSTFL